MESSMVELHGKTAHLRRKPVMDGEAYLRKLDEKNLTSDGGALIPDPTPVAPPVGYVRQPSMTERIREMIRNERLQAELAAAGAETFDEADDFDVGDDYDPKSPYEEIFDPPIPDVAHKSSTGVPSPGGGEGAGGLSSEPSKTHPGVPGAASPQKDTGKEPPAAKAAGEPPKAS